MKKIVTIGGGTGSYTLLKGLKNYDVELTAIVSMVDNGSHSGELRDEFGVLPPGDLRNCLLALSDESKILRELFEYRFGNDCVGNRIIAALQNITGKENYVQETSKLLNIKGKVLPISIDETNLYGETNTNRKLNGQVEVSYNVQGDEKINKIWLSPSAFVYREVAEAIRKADLIVICPGDLYGSILPNFLVQGVREAIKDTKAKIVYVCNLVTKQGTYGFTAGDFIKEIEKYMGKEIDCIILNKMRPSNLIVDKYKGEDSEFVEPVLEDLKRKIISENLLIEHKSDGKMIARHNPEETARLIMSLC